MNSRRIRSNSVDTSDRISINAEAPPSEIAVNNDQAPFLEECYSPFSAKKGIAGSPLKDSFIEPRPRQSGLKRFAKIHYFLVPIELITFFYIFAMNFSTQITQQYFFQKVFAAALSEENCSSTYYCNVSLPGFCLKEGKIINETGVHVFIDGQKRVNEYSMGSTLIYVLPSLLMTILTGPLSDRFGRKPFLLFAVIGQVVSTIITLFITYYDLNVFIFYVASFFAGMLGGFGSMLSLSFSYVTDITPKVWLTIRMGLLEASIFLAVAASSGVVGLLVDNVKCDFIVPMWVLFSTSVAGLLFCIFMSESLSVETRASNSNKGFKVLVRGFKLLFWKSYLTKHLWEIWLIVIVMVVGFFTSAGTALILQYFLHNKPLEWNYTTIGFYQATSSASHLLILIVVLPFLVVVKVPEIAISFAGSVLACGSYVFIALLSKDWEMFLAGIVLGFEVLVAPGLRARIARIIHQKDTGSVFSVIALLQSVSTLAAAVIFNEIYSPGSATHTTDRGNRIKPQVVFWIATAAWALAVVILIVIFFGTIKKTEKTASKLFVNANIFHRNKYGGVSDS